jgi:hypothetical protein
VTTYPVSRVPRPGIIRVAHSPDADDAFMFWAMAAGKIDTAGRRYVHELSDIESLNRRALAGELEVTAVSTRTRTSRIATRCSPTAPASAIATVPASSAASRCPRIRAARCAIVWSRFPAS